MIRIRIKELLLEKSFKEGKRISMEDVAEATGIHRVTLSLMGGPREANTTTKNLDRLCHYFGCEISDLVKYVPSAPPAPHGRSRKAKEALATH